MMAVGEEDAPLTDDERAIWFLEQFQRMVQKQDYWRGYIPEGAMADFDFSDGEAWAVLQRAIDAIRGDELRCPVTEMKRYGWVSVASDHYAEWRRAEMDKRRWDQARALLASTDDAARPDAPGRE